jgi:quinol monooxygenase YgiN
VLVLHFKMRCRPEAADAVAEALAAVVEPSRQLPGVVSFDIGRDLTDSSTFVATEVFTDEAARSRQESLSEVAAVMELLPRSLASPPELVAYESSVIPAPTG